MSEPGEPPAESPGEGRASEFVLLVAQAWRFRIPDVLAALRAAGAEETAVNEDCGIVEGKVDTDRVEAVSRLAQVAALAWRRISDTHCQSRTAS